MTTALQKLKWSIVRKLGKRGQAAYFWSGQSHSGVASLDTPAGSDALWYDVKPYHHLPENQKYPAGFEEQNLYLTMRDGAKIAISVYTPRGLKPGDKIPTVLNQTCYYRAYQISKPFDKVVTGAPYFVGYLVPRGYAYVRVDVRGTGASGGARPYNASPDEQEDTREILDWIVNQPWSDGNVGTEGVSYMGVTSALSVGTGHPSLKAAVPQFALIDAYEEFCYPGGIFCERIIRTWSDHVHHLHNALDSKKDWIVDNLVAGVMPVDDDKDGSQLAEIVKQHKMHGDTYDMTRAAIYRDSELPGLKQTGYPHRHSECTPNASEVANGADHVPIYNIAGWWDGAFMRGNIIRHVLHSQNNKSDKLVIGPWDHGAHQNLSNWSPSRRPAASRVYEMIRFFDRHLKGISTGVETEAAVHYFTMGEEKWKASDAWPPQKVTKVPYYFGTHNTLSQKKPTQADGSDEYSVDFSATTGLTNRWWTIVNTEHDIEYPNRTEQQAKLLTYTTDPLDHEIEVTGHPVLVLHAASTATDGAFHIYLEDICPDGQVHYVTEGILRASHRKLAACPWPLDIPYHTHNEADCEPLSPGEPVELQIELYATSYLFQKGHSIRIGIAGADCDTFERVPNDGSIPVVTVFHDAVRPSHIDLPIYPR